MKRRCLRSNKSTLVGRKHTGILHTRNFSIDCTSQIRRWLSLNVPIGHERLAIDYRFHLFKGQSNLYNRTMTKLSFENMGEFSQSRANELFESHKKYLEWRKTEWATRGPEALAKRQAARAATHNTWRQMKGFNLFAHEMNHAGNKPFVIGMG